MKITEVIERECCDRVKDLLPYKDNYKKFGYFCKHCGQRWEWNRRMDAGGGGRCGWYITYGGDD